MITISLSLAFCTVLFRRFMDAYTKRVPVAVPVSAYSNTTALLMFSGAMFYLYYHLKRGTLVRIGVGNKLLRKTSSTSRCGIQKHRTRNNSWILRNARACRTKCTDAMYRLARQSVESLVDHKLSPSAILKRRTRANSRSSQVTDKESSNSIITPECDIIYNNDSFQSGSSSSDIMKQPRPSRHSKSDELGRKPFLRKCSESKRLHDLTPPTNAPHKKNHEKKTHEKKSGKASKVTRKTRSGKIYAYRL